MCNIPFLGGTRFTPLLFPLLLQLHLSASSPVLSMVLDLSWSSFALAILLLAPRPPASPQPSAVKPQLLAWAQLSARPQEDHGHGGGESLRDALLLKEQKG